MASKYSMLAPKGVTFMQILVEGTAPNGPPATQPNLKSWVGNVMEPFTATLDSVDPQAKLEDYFGVQRDQFMIIDLKTMQLVDVLEANPQGAVDEVLGLLM